MSESWIYFLAGIGTITLAALALAGGMYVVAQIIVWRHS